MKQYRVSQSSREMWLMCSRGPFYRYRSCFLWLTLLVCCAMMLQSLRNMKRGGINTTKIANTRWRIHEKTCSRCSSVKIDRGSFERRLTDGFSFPGGVHLLYAPNSLRSEDARRYAVHWPHFVEADCSIKVFYERNIRRASFIFTWNKAQGRIYLVT